MAGKKRKSEWKCGTCGAFCDTQELLHSHINKTHAKKYRGPTVRNLVRRNAAAAAAAAAPQPPPPEPEAAPAAAAPQPPPPEPEA